MNSVVIHAAALAETGNSPVLREGSSVFVRILNQSGAGKYTVSFSGLRFSVFSEREFKPGQTFSARIKISDGKIQLVPADRSAQGEKLFFQQNIESGKINIENILKNTGLPQDNVSAMLLMNLKMLGMKFDPDLLRRIHDFSGHFVNREKKSAALSLILEKKGIKLNTAQFKALLDLLESDSIMEDESDAENNLNSGDNKNELFYSSFGYLNPLNSDIKKSFIQFFKNIFTENNGNENSLLAVFNHKGFKMTSGSFSGNWIHIPFEFYLKKEKGFQNGKGFANLLLDERKLKNCLCRFDFPENSYRFNLFFYRNKCSKILADNSLMNSEFLDRIVNQIKNTGLCTENFYADFSDNLTDEDFPSDFTDFYFINRMI